MPKQHDNMVRRITWTFKIVKILKDIFTKVSICDIIVFLEECLYKVLVMLLSGIHFFFCQGSTIVSRNGQIFSKKRLLAMRNKFGNSSLVTSNVWIIPATSSLLPAASSLSQRTLEFAMPHKRQTLLTWRTLDAVLNLDKESMQVLHLQHSNRWEDIDVMKKVSSLEEVCSSSPEEMETTTALKSIDGLVYAVEINEIKDYCNYAW
jgi:hypothetical protein